MDDEPWKEPDDEGYQLPRSWSEIRERWHGDSALRVIVGVVVVFVVASFLICAGLR